MVIEDEQLIDILRMLVDQAENRLFTYQDEQGEERVVSAAEINSVIAQIAGPAFSAKDFRTWGGSRVALEARVDGLGSLETIDATAAALGNTRAVARSSYVHPKVLDASDDQITDVWRRSRRSSTFSRADRALYKLLDS